jgi:hypothetical protein
MKPTYKEATMAARREAKAHLVQRNDGKNWEVVITLPQITAEQLAETIQFHEYHLDRELQEIDSSIKQRLHEPDCRTGDLLLSDLKRIRFDILARVGRLSQLWRQLDNIRTFKNLKRKVIK